MQRCLTYVRHDTASGYASRSNPQNDGTVWETVIISVKSGIEWGVFERCLSWWWMCVESEFPHSLIWHVKIITTSEKRTNDVACNSWAGAWSEFRNSVPSSLVLSVGTESTMKERHEKEYKSKEARLKTAEQYKGRRRSVPMPSLNPKLLTGCSSLLHACNLFCLPLYLLLLLNIFRNSVYF